MVKRLTILVDSDGRGIGDPCLTGTGLGWLLQWRAFFRWLLAHDIKIRFGSAETLKRFHGNVHHRQHVKVLIDPFAEPSVRFGEEIRFWQDYAQASSGCEQSVGTFHKYEAKLGIGVVVARVSAAGMLTDTVFRLFCVSRANLQFLAKRWIRENDIV